MKERPILFSAPMVRAILAGTKTQTRRVVKYDIRGPSEPMDTWDWYDKKGKWAGAHGRGFPFKKTNAALLCPYGQPGDRLWVRETSRAHEITTKEAEADTFGLIDRMGLEVAPYGLDGVVYAADNAFREIDNSREASERWMKMRAYRGARGATVPGIHMPRWASRITLEVTGVRVEKLQDISEADAIAEGVEWNKCPHTQTEASLMAQLAASHIGMAAHYEAKIDYIGGYRWLWESINGRPKLPSNEQSARHKRVKNWLDKHPETTSWDANPWVWVIEFKRVEGGAA